MPRFFKHLQGRGSGLPSPPPGSRENPEEFGLLLTDYNMPGMSGLDLARAILAIRPDLPVAILSGFVDEGLRAAAASLGVRELVPEGATSALCEALARLVPLRPPQPAN